MGVNSEPDALAQSAVETPQPYQAKIDKVDAILREALQPASPVTLETGDSADSKPAETWDVKALTEKLGVEAEAFYKQFKLRVSDDTELTLGELKDAYKPQKALLEQEAEVDRQRAEYQADQLRTKRELDEVLATIDPQSIRPEMAQVYQRQLKDYQSREREKTLRSIPEWSDARKETADKAAILEAIKPYGKGKDFLDALYDADSLRLLRTFAKQAERLKELEKAALPKPRMGVEPRKAQTVTPEMQHGRLKAQRTRGQISRIDAANEVLKQAGIIK